MTRYCIISDKSGVHKIYSGKDSVSRMKSFFVEKHINGYRIGQTKFCAIRNSEIFIGKVFNVDKKTGDVVETTKEFI
jgi:hypothetical protein